jgi:hypothetical protein
MAQVPFLLQSNMEKPTQSTTYLHMYYVGICIKPTHSMNLAVLYVVCGSNKFKLDDE